MVTDENDHSSMLYGVEAALNASPDDPAPTPAVFARDFSLSDRVAVVTGGYGGLGLEAALALAEAGARTVYCLGRAAEPPERWTKVQAYTAQTSCKTGVGRMEYVCADVTDQGKMWKTLEEIGTKEGRLDVCITGHGVVSLGKSCLDLTADDIDYVLDVNFKGALYSAQAAARQMIRFRNGGSIVLMASIAGAVDLRDIPLTAYGASKAAIIQLARSMACELGPSGIRVNSLSNGFMYTKMISDYIDDYPSQTKGANPMGRVGHAREQRGTIVWLASDASSFCTGADIRMDGGHCAW